MNEVWKKALKERMIKKVEISLQKGQAQIIIPLTIPKQAFPVLGNKEYYPIEQILIPYK
jgi:hypothetical protein